MNNYYSKQAASSMATANASAVEAAKAVNALLGLSRNDQGALLEDYFL